MKKVISSLIVGIHVYFYEISNFLDELKRYVIAFGGEVTENISIATHIICDKNWNKVLYHFKI